MIKILVYVVIAQVGLLIPMLSADFLNERSSQKVFTRIIWYSDLDNRYPTTA